MIHILSPTGGRPNLGPISPGEVREYRLEGDGPFLVSSKCFVDKPRPPGPGFVDCPECQDSTVMTGGTFSISASPKMWGRASGQISVRIVDRKGEDESFNLSVQTDIGGRFEGGGLAMG